MLLYGTKLPETPTFAPDYASTIAAENEQRQAADSLWDATRELQVFRDNSNAEDNALIEAYERRNRAIFDATGVQLPNPRRDFTGDLQEANRLMDSGGDPWTLMEKAERQWSDRAATLARERPEHAGIIGADRPIKEDAFAIARAAEGGFAKAQEQATAAGVGGTRSLGNTLGGGIAGMLRDPLQVATLFVGGGASAPARSVVGRVLQTMLTEAAVNAGVEAGVQAASYDWKKSAGVEHGLGPSLQQVGLAALFGGGVGGLIAGGREVFRLTGKTVPEEAFGRAAAGNTETGDLPAIAEALGVKLDSDTLRSAELAAEQVELDRAAFGTAPDLVTEADAERIAAEAVRSIENPERMVRDAAIDRIVRSEFPLGSEPRRPVTLTQFLASRSVGGIRDDGGELAAMGLIRKFVPGGGALVRSKGRTLDMAREAAAEAGYFDGLYGTPERATAESTTDDLLRALRQEAAGEPVFSPRNDGGRIFDWQQYEAGRQRQASYRRVVEEVDGAIDELGIEHRLDDAVLRRVAELVDDDVDAIGALERALDEDYRSYADALSERGEDAFDAADIPFFEDARTVPPAGGTVREASADGAARGRSPDAPDGEQLSGARGDEGTQGGQPLRQPGDTPEPGTSEAAEISDLVLLEARGSETTAAGEQMLIDGVKPVSPKVKLDAQAAKSMRGGDKPLPEGGLFDLDARKQLDIWDAMPAAKDADGTMKHTTHEDMIADADRSAFLGDLISSCRD